MTTEWEIARAIDRSLAYGEVELFDDSASYHTDEGVAIITLESGEMFEATVRKVACRHPTCGNDAYHMVNGTPVCHSHAREYEDFLKHGG